VCERIIPMFFLSLLKSCTALARPVQTLHGTLTGPVLSVVTAVLVKNQLPLLPRAVMGPCLISD